MNPTEISEGFKELKISKDQDINILLLGETGVGKSTFVNSIANYLHYKSFKKATKGELLILIPSTITVTDKNFESVAIRVGSEDKNEYQEVGAAGTQDVKTYVFPIGEGSTRLRFIDTPGMGDPRGVDQDDVNCENILAYLSNLKELHAICYLLKPTNTRITVFFEYCVKQILSRLEKSASKNIIFVFTNTRGTNYTPGDTLPCLRRMVEEIKAKPPNVEIPLRGDNIFAVDNEAFRYLVATKNKVEYDEAVKERFIESWKKSSKECWRLISYIVGDAANEPLKPHQLQNTMSVNEARRLIVQLAQPLADISQLIYDNIRILERHRNNLRMENQNLEGLKKKLYIPIVDLKVTQLTQPVTVCTSTKCVEMIKVGDNQKAHYRQRCHDPCYLTNVGKEIVGDPNLINCAAMNGNRMCGKCTCDYLVHMHVYYMSTTVEDKIMDQSVQSNINQKESAIREAQRLIGEIDKRKTELEEERQIIIKSTAQFAHFLQNNAISPFNDSYKEYIQYLISREQSLGRFGDQGVVNNLKQLLQQYDEIKAAFDNSVSLTQKLGLNTVVSFQVTAQTVISTVHELYKLKHNGKKIRELLKKQNVSRKAEHNESCEYVHQSYVGLSASESKDKSKKGKKKDGKSTDDEKSKTEKGAKGSSGVKYDNKIFRGRAHSHNIGTRGCSHVQRVSNVDTRITREPPPPYSTSDYHNRRSGQRADPSPSGYDKSDDQRNVVVKVELLRPNGNTRDRQDQHHGPPPQDHYYGPPPQSLHYGPPDHRYDPPPQGPSYRPPPQDLYGPSPQGHRHRQPPQDHHYGPPSQGRHHGPPGQSPYYGSGYHGQNYGPPQGNYEQNYRPPQSNYGTSRDPYYEPVPYPEPSQRQYSQYHGTRQYQGPSSGSSQGRYQRSNAGNATRFKRGGGRTRRAKSKGGKGKDKKSGTERSSSSDSESSSSSSD